MISAPPGSGFCPLLPDYVIVCPFSLSLQHFKGVGKFGDRGHRGDKDKATAIAGALGMERIVQLLRSSLIHVRHSMLGVCGQGRGWLHVHADAEGHIEAAYVGTRLNVGFEVRIVGCPCCCTFEEEKLRSFVSKSLFYPLPE